MDAFRIDAATMRWGWKVGRLGFCSGLRGRLTIVQAGAYHEIWKPLGLGLYWRNHKYLKLLHHSKHSQH